MLVFFLSKNSAEKNNNAGIMQSIQLWHKNHVNKIYLKNIKTEKVIVKFL